MLAIFAPMFTTPKNRRPTLRGVAVERARHIVGCNECKDHYLGRTPRLTF